MKTKTQFDLDALSIQDFCSQHNIPDPVNDFVALYVAGEAPTVSLINGMPRVMREDAATWRARQSVRAVLRQNGGGRYDG